MNNKKVNPKLLTHELQIIKLAVKRLQNTKFHAMILISVMLVGIFSLYPAISSLMNNVIIRSTGRIATVAQTAYRSEIRGMFFHGNNYGGNLMDADWALMAQTCRDYGITDAFVDLGGLPEGSLRTAMLPEILNAFHPLGIKVHISWNVLIGGRTSPEDMRAVDSQGVSVGWGCPTKQATRNFIKTSVETIASYDIDGFMFDYARYEGQDICFCPDCKAAFEEWLGETITDWPGDFAYPGSRFTEFAEWRNVPVTKIVKDIRNWMLAINPDLEFSAAVFPLGDDCPIYWRKFIGQDTSDWIRNDYLGLVAPMQYTGDVAEIKMRIRDHLKYWTAGVEGKLPLTIFVSNCYPSLLTPEQFKAVIDAVREMGADGWIIWRYGGPGNYAGDTNPPDVRDYLSVIDMPDIFTMGYMQVSAGQTEAVISWATDKPATSKVEYRTSPLFNWTLRKWMDTNYWHPEYISGNITDDNTPVVLHSVTLTDLLPRTKYYFRVQSQDPSGIATSKVLTFTTES